MRVHLGNKSGPSDNGKLRFRPPTLIDPLTIKLKDTPTGRRAMMDPTRDYFVDGRGVLGQQDFGIELNGGRNVIAIGLEQYFATDAANDNNIRRSLYVKGNPAQTVKRTIHIEGFKSSGFHREICDIDDQGEPGITVQVCNWDIPDPVLGTQAGNHSDIIQSWRGPTNLRIDRLYAKYAYQGFFLNPHQFSDPTNPNKFAELGLYEFSRIYLEGTSDSGVPLYLIQGRQGVPPMVSTRQVWIRPSPTKAFPGQLLLTDPAYWGSDVHATSVGRRSFVSSKPGRFYVSPGYE